MSEPTITPRLIADHGLTPGEFERICSRSRPGAQFHGTGHFLGDVVGALLLQKLPGSPEAASHPRPRGHPGARGKRRGGGHRRRRRHASSRSNPTTTPPSSSPTRARPPAWAASSATSSPWAPGPWPCWTRCASGRSTEPQEPLPAGRRGGGIAHYGNCIGVPTVGGEVYFETPTAATPWSTSSAWAGSPGRQIFYGQARGVGNPVIYVGAKTGRDGIHGATMASSEFDEKSQEKRPTVQVGDPFHGETAAGSLPGGFRTGAVVGIQDMGAAGLTCSTCEMGGRGGDGHRDRPGPGAPAGDRHDRLRDHAVRIPGTDAADRGARGREEEVFAIFRKWGLDAVVIGEVTADARMEVRHRGSRVADIPNAALTDEAPVYERPMAPSGGPGCGQCVETGRSSTRPATCCGCSRTSWPGPISAASAGSGNSTTTWSGPTPPCCRAATRRSCALKGRRGGLAMTLDGNGRYMLAGSAPRGAGSPWPRPAATWFASAPGRWRRPIA